FARFEEWIARGRVGALAHEHALRELAAAPGRPSSPAAPPASGEVSVTRVEVRGTRSAEAERVALRALALPAPGLMDASTVDEALARLYATNLFSRARYRIETQGADAVMVFEVVEQVTNQVGMGLRYDDHRKAALLFTGLLRNV